MGKKESSLLHSLVRHPGWEVFASMQKDRFNEHYNKLRSYKRDDAFYRCQGYLNSIDDMFRDVELTIDDIDQYQDEEGPLE
jgi:hypothetical protein